MAIEGMGPDTPTAVNESGAKQSALQYRFDLFPARALFAVAEVLKHGADKYGVDNWRGIPTGDHLNHALAHAYAHIGGDDQELHLAHHACRALMALEMHLAEMEAQRFAGKPRPPRPEHLDAENDWRNRHDAIPGYWAQEPGR